MLLKVVFQMNVRLCWMFLVAKLWPRAGIRRLGTTVGGVWDDSVPGPVFHFPAHHGAHRFYRIRWWYVTANSSWPRTGRRWVCNGRCSARALAPGGRRTRRRSGLGHAAVDEAQAHFVGSGSRAGLWRDGGRTRGARSMAFIDHWAMAGETLDQVCGDGHRGRSLPMTVDAGPPRAADLSRGGWHPLKFGRRAGELLLSNPSMPWRGADPAGGRGGGNGGLPGSTGNGSSQPLSESQEGWDWFSPVLRGQGTS